METIDKMLEEKHLVVESKSLFRKLNDRGKASKTDIESWHLICERLFKNDYKSALRTIMKQAAACKAPAISNLFIPSEESYKLLELVCLEKESNYECFRLIYDQIQFTQDNSASNFLNNTKDYNIYGFSFLMTASSISENQDITEIIQFLLSQGDG
jgi:hypothetical protein